MKYIYSNPQIIVCSMLFLVLLSSCGSVEDSLSGGGCQVVANPQAESFFKVTNNLSSGFTMAFIRFCLWRRYETW